MHLAANSLTIPDAFTDTVYRIFGEDGKQWLTELDDRLHKARAKWQLSNCEIANNLSINLILFAQSPDYGDVVLKMGVPNPEFDTEITALSLYKGKDICACYETNTDLGAMLLGRVIPGYNLKTMPEKTCLEIGADILPNLAIPIHDKRPLPHFADWMQRAFAKARTENQVSEQMLFFLKPAERFYAELTAEDPTEVLLHGDLHHENILYSETGGWKVIDPKGAIGAPCLETGRFIQNHLDLIDEAHQKQSLDEMASLFGDAFQRSKRTIGICAFLDCVLSRCWTLEDHLSPSEFVAAQAEAIERSAFYLDYINELSSI